MFKLKSIGKVRGDCTQPYKVILDKEYTVGEFIETVLGRKGEWGYIGIEYGRSFFGNPNCEYKWGKLITPNLPDDFLPLKISSMRADGGWSRMDYLITLD